MLAFGYVDADLQLQSNPVLYQSDPILYSCEWSERLKRRGEAEAVFLQDRSSLRPAPRDTRPGWGTFGQSSPSHIS